MPYKTQHTGCTRNVKWTSIHDVPNELNILDALNMSDGSPDMLDTLALPRDDTGENGQVFSNVVLPGEVLNLPDGTSGVAVAPKRVAENIVYSDCRQSPTCRTGLGHLW